MRRRVPDVDASHVGWGGLSLGSGATLGSPLGRAQCGCSGVGEELSQVVAWELPNVSGQRVGYQRVSSLEQNPQRQLDGIEAYQSTGRS